MINSGKEWDWMDSNQKLKRAMNFVDIKDDMKWVEKAILNKSNTNLHYPGLKQLINIFYNKWKSNDTIKILDSYKLYIRSLLRSELGR